MSAMQERLTKALIPRIQQVPRETAAQIKAQNAAAGKADAGSRIASIVRSPGRNPGRHLVDRRLTEVWATSRHTHPGDRGYPLQLLDHVAVGRISGSDELNGRLLTARDSHERRISMAGGPVQSTRRHCPDTGVTRRADGREHRRL